MLDSIVTEQATIIAYINDFKLLMILSFLAMPLVLLLRKPKVPQEVDHAIAME